jgi:hypothetical protein
MVGKPPWTQGAFTLTVGFAAVEEADRFRAHFAGHSAMFDALSVPA